MRLIDNKLTWYFYRRPNCHTPNGEEYALDVQFGIQLSRWTLITFDDKPSEEDLKLFKETALRAFEIYHATLSTTKPAFSVEVVLDLDLTDEELNKPTPKKKCNKSRQKST